VNSANVGNGKNIEFCSRLAALASYTAVGHISLLVERLLGNPMKQEHLAGLNGSSGESWDFQAVSAGRSVTTILTRVT